MKMKLKHLSSIAEIFASIAVILSLVFVGIQLMEGNRVTKATVNELAVQSEIDMVTVFLDHSTIWDKIITGAPIEDEEMRQAILLFNIFMLDTESRYEQLRSGYLDPARWDGRLRLLPEVVSYPFYEVWRNSPGGRNHSDHFLALLDSMSSGK